VRVERETDVGIETLRMHLPAVVTVDLRLNQPRYAALAAILRARKKPLELVSLDALGVIVEPRVRVLAWQGASGDRICRMSGSVDELVDRLRAAKVL